MTSRRPRILGLGGSFRGDSKSLAALKFSLACAERAGAETLLLSIQDVGLPFYDDRGDPTTYPDSVHKFLRHMRRCDGLLLSSPVYHGTMSGAVKNGLDYLELLADDTPPWLEEKVVGLITVAGGRPRTDALVSLEIACRALHAWIVPVPVSISETSFEADELADQTIKDRLERLATRVVVEASARL